MNKKILLVFLVIVVFVLSLIIVLMFKNDGKTFDEYIISNQHHTEVVEGVFINEDKEDSYEELELVGKLFKEQGLVGGLTKKTLDKIGEGEIPNIVKEYGASVWYEISTADGIYYGIYINDEFIIGK